MKIDKFEISNGNIKLLQAIPMMMTNRAYRRKLRMLFIDFMMEIKSDRRID